MPNDTKKSIDCIEVETVKELIGNNMIVQIIDVRSKENLTIIILKMQYIFLRYFKRK
jgi:hypothetical protein